MSYSVPFGQLLAHGIAPGLGCVNRKGCFVMCEKSWFFLFQMDQSAHTAKDARQHLLSSSPRTASMRSTRRPEFVPVIRVEAGRDMNSMGNSREDSLADMVSDGILSST